MQAVVEMASATMKPLSQTFIGRGTDDKGLQPESVKAEPVDAK